MEKKLFVKEPNLLIEAKQKMKREELLIWSWCLVNARFWITDGEGREITLEELEEVKKRKEIFYAVSCVDLKELREKFPKTFNKDKVFYWKKILKGLEEKIGFEVNYELYKRALEELGFDYILEKFKQNKADKYFGIATIVAVGLSSDGELTITYTPLVAPLLVLLKKWFTLYSFEEILRLDLKPSIVLYRVFKEKLGLRKKEIIIDINTLNALFGLKKTSTWDLRRKYLEPAVKEINEKTSLRVEMKPIRRGRGGKIVGFHFKVWEIVSPKGGLADKIKELIETLSQDKALEVSPKELAEALLSLKRVNPATALWFMLHYPEGEPRLYAWEHIKWVEETPKIKYPDKFLESLITDKKEELKWLLDQRTKDLIRKELEKLIEKGEEKKKTETDKEMEELLNRLEEIKPLIRLYYDLIAEYFEVDDLKEFLDNLIAKKDKEKLGEIIDFVESLGKAPLLKG